MNKVIQRFPHILCFILLATYIYLFAKSLSPAWFNPQYLTDDALQQSFPFHKIYNPGIFEDDLITRAMVGYLAPAHYFIHYFITVLTQSPIITGHWVMLIQIFLSSVFIYFAISKLSNSIAGLFGVFWFFHTRNLVLAMTGGLTRGWASVVTAAFLCFAIREKHYAVLLTLFLGCMLHPPATIVAALCYGLSLIYCSLTGEKQSESRKKLKGLIIFSPICILITLYVIHRPDDIGQMISKSEAISSPSFENPGGRFAFLPLRSISAELGEFGIRPFVNNFFSPPAYAGNAMPVVVIFFLLTFILYSVFRKNLLHSSVWIYIVCLSSVYLMARELIFKLYVPDRYLQGPLGIWLLIAFTASFWKLGANFQLKKKVIPFLIALACIGSFFLTQSFLPKTLLPKHGSNALVRISNDGWIESEAKIEFKRLSTIGNRLALKFDHWRPFNAAPAEIEFSACNKTLFSRTITAENNFVEISDFGDCSTPSLGLRALNPLKIPDGRTVSAKLKSVEIQSKLGGAIPKLKYILPVLFLISAAVFLISGSFFSPIQLNFNKSLGGLLILSSIIALGSGTGLSPAHNFNVKIDRKGELYNWIREKTDKNALFAGHPSHIDEIQLLGIRQALVTTETAHPFYLEYFSEISRRLEQVWNAYYETDLARFLEIMEAESIDYFVFRRYDFDKRSLKKAIYDKPFDKLVKKLSRKKFEDYLFIKLGLIDINTKADFLVFSDEQSAVVSIELLRQFFSKIGNLVYFENS